METFTAAKPLVRDPNFSRQRRTALAGLEIAGIDPPLRGIITSFSRLPALFTLQSCWGHFLYPGCREPENTAPLPSTPPDGRIEYRIAYIAFCLQNSPAGRILYRDLSRIVQIDPDNIQFGSADWFWDKHVNSYVLQVEPLRACCRDRVEVTYPEARNLEKIKRDFFRRLGLTVRTCME